MSDVPESVLQLAREIAAEPFGTPGIRKLILAGDCDDSQLIYPIVQAIIRTTELAAIHLEVCWPHVATPELRDAIRRFHHIQMKDRSNG